MTGRRVAALMLMVVLLAACSQPQEVIGSGANGVDGKVGGVELHGVRIQGTSPSLQPGDDAVAWLLLIAGRKPDTLTGVTSDWARDVQIRWDRDCDGTAEPVGKLPLAPNVGGPQDSPGEGADESDSYHLRLIDVSREVLIGTNVPMTFHLARAGDITLQVPVVADTQARAYPSARCSPRPT